MIPTKTIAKVSPARMNGDTLRPVAIPDMMIATRRFVTTVKKRSTIQRVAGTEPV